MNTGVAVIAEAERLAGEMVFQWYKVLSFQKSTWKVVGHAGKFVFIGNLNGLEALSRARLSCFVDECKFECVLVGAAATTADGGELEAGGGQDFHEGGHDFVPVCGGSWELGFGV